MATTTASACGCTANGTGSASGGLTGRVTPPDPADYWPDHDRSVPTEFVNERNRYAVMWRL